MDSRHAFVPCAALVAAFGSGCIVVSDSGPPCVPSSSPAAYEGCSHDTNRAEGGCRGGTICRHPLYGVSSGQLPGLCTNPCASTADCAEGLGVTCERFVDGPLCVVRCSEAVACPSGTICADRSRINGEAVSICI